MTSFGLFSVNQLSSHPHVSRTNYATAMDAQDRLQKLHDPNAFQAAHPSGRLGRLLEKQNIANAGDQDMDELMSAESSAVQGRTLAGDSSEEARTGAAASFVPIQPRQAVLASMTSPMAAVSVAQMSTVGPPQPDVMALGAPPDSLHGSPQQPLVPRYLDNRPQQVSYVQLQPSAPTPQDPHASHHAFPHYRPADSSLPGKRKRGRPKRADPKNVSAAPLLPYPPRPPAVHPLQAPVFIRPHPSPIMSLPPPEAHSHSQVPQSLDSAQSPSHSSAGSPTPDSTHLQNQEDLTQLKRKRGRPRKMDPIIGAIDPSLSNVPIVSNPQALGDPGAPATLQLTSLPLSRDDAAQSSKAQDNFSLKESVALSSTLQSIHKPTSGEEGGHAANVDPNNANITSPEPDENLAEVHAPSAPDPEYSEDDPTHEPPPSAQPDHGAGPSHEVPHEVLQSQEFGIPSLSQKKKPGRPRKSVTNSQTPQTRIKPQPGNSLGFAERQSEHAQSHNSESAMSQTRPRGRPKKIDPKTEGATPLALRPPPEKLSDFLLSSDDEGETPDPLSFDALIRLEPRSDFNSQKSFAENNEQLDPGREHAPNPDLEQKAFTHNKPRGRPRKSGPNNPNPTSSLPFPAVSDDEENLEIAQTTETRMFRSSLAETAQLLQSMGTKVVQTKETIQINEFSPNEEGFTGFQSQIEDESMPPKQRKGRPIKSGDKIVPSWATQPEALTDSTQLPKSSAGPQEEDNANSIPLKKSRGRPRKSALPKELDPSAKVSEPPRSQPADHHQASDSADEGTTLPPAKKPRGRPRKSEPTVRMVPSWGAQPEELQNPPPPVGASPQIVSSQTPGTPLLMKKGPGRPRKVVSTNEAASSPRKMQLPPDDDLAETSQDAMQLVTPTQSLKKRPGRPRKGDTTNGVAPTPLREKSRPKEHDSVSPPSQSPPEEDLPQETKKRRGRPSKAAIEERASDAANQKLRPGTSLSSKPQTHEAAQFPEPAAGFSVPQKRRRGRPSKVDVLAVEGGNTTQAQNGDAIPTPVPAKKGPGRPRKSQGGNSAASGEGGDPESCVVQ